MLRVTFGVAVVTAIITLLIPNIYTGSAKLIVPQEDQSLGAALLSLSQLGPLSGVAGNALGLKDPNQLYAGMLQSRTVADHIIARFGLKKLYESRSWLPVEMSMIKVRDQLADASKINVGDDGIISIDVEDRDPKLAAGIANAYIEELNKLNRSLAITNATQRRVYYEKQVQAAKQQLEQAEADLEKTQEKSGMIKLDDQATAILGAVASLKAQVAAKEVELGAMRSFATKENPAYVRARQELAGLKGELTRAERGKIIGLGDILVPTSKIPSVAMQYIRRLRDVKYYTAISELLSKQYELARIDEARDIPTIQVVDRAIEPDYKTKPSRTLITVLAAFIAFVLTAFWIVVMESARRTPEFEDQIGKLKRLLRWNVN